MIALDGGSLTIEQLLAIADRGESVELTADARARVQASREVVPRTASTPGSDRLPTSRSRLTRSRRCN